MSQEDNETLLSSKFQLPDDYKENPQDYEFWSVKVPVKVEMSVLNGSTMQFRFLQEQSTKGLDPIFASFEINGEKYSFCNAPLEEVSTYRILAGNDDDEQGKEMKPLPIPFHKHFSLVQTTNAAVADVELAPSNHRAPVVDVEKVPMRIPYVPIPQKTGLKRRWNVMGSTAKWAPPSAESLLNDHPIKRVKRDSMPTNPMMTLVEASPKQQGNSGKKSEMKFKKEMKQCKQ